MPARPPPSPQPPAAACPRLGGQPAAVLSPARPPSRRSRSPCFTRLASHAPPLADLKFGADTWEGKARGQGAGHGCPRPLGLAPESRRQPQQPGQPPVPARLGDPDSGAFLPTPWSAAREQGQRELRLVTDRACDTGLLMPGWVLARCRVFWQHGRWAPRPLRHPGAALETPPSSGSGDPRATWP